MSYLLTSIVKAEAMHLMSHLLTTILKAEVTHLLSHLLTSILKAVVVHLMAHLLTTILKASVHSLPYLLIRIKQVFLCFPDEGCLNQPLLYTGHSKQWPLQKSGAEVCHKSSS